VFTQNINYSNIRKYILNYSKLTLLILILLKKRVRNFKELKFKLFKFIDLSIIYCNRIIIKPTPNSTADKIKKKKVKESRLRLLYIIADNKTRIYKVIHNNSAVNNKCNAVLTFIIILRNKIKKRIKIKFKS